ncbi:MAG: hypothetical protein ACRET1_00675 [Burkholderiales bacterium]
MNEPVGGADFLGRLVDRARGGDGGLQPRLPSLFEPSRFTGVRSIIDERESPLDEAVGSLSQPTSDGDGIRHWDADRAPPTQRDPLAFHLRPQQPLLYQATMTDPVAADSLPTRFPRLRTQTAITAFIASDDRNTAAPASDLARGASLDAGDDFRPVRTDARAAAAGDETARDHRPSQTGTLTSSFDQTAHAIVVAPEVAQRRSTSQQPHAGNPPISAQPVINVTIGRVEVRATQSAPTPRHAKAQGPQPMSLDDYLRRRGGRR